MADSKGLHTHFVQPCQSCLPELRRRPFSNQEFVYHSGGIELVVGILLHEKDFGCVVFVSDMLHQFEPFPWHGIVR